MVALVRRYGVEATIFVVALAARLLVPVFGGGYRGFVGSDQAVYYAGSMAVSFGNVPYSGFSFVHPPVSLVALQPAAWVGRLTTDHVGFIVGNVLFALLGAVTAVLVARVARATGGGVGAQLAGGLFYAVWMGSVGAEFSSRLEPLGNVVFVTGLLLLTRVRALEEQASARLTLLAGAVLGLSVSVKIWWAAPVLFVLLWDYGRSRDPRRLGRLGARRRRGLGGRQRAVVPGFPRTDVGLRRRGAARPATPSSRALVPPEHHDRRQGLADERRPRRGGRGRRRRRPRGLRPGHPRQPGVPRHGLPVRVPRRPAAVEPVLLPPLRRLLGGPGGAHGRRHGSRPGPYGARRRRDVDGDPRFRRTRSSAWWRVWP